MSATESLRHTLDDTLDYVALLVGKDEIQNYRLPRRMSLLKDSGPVFLVVEAKVLSSRLMDHLPQAVVKMMACVKSLNQKYLRGVLTNGQIWIFVIVITKSDLERPGEGYYYFSEPIELKRNKREIDEESANTISGILASWKPYQCCVRLNRSDVSLHRTLRAILTFSRSMSHIFHRSALCAAGLAVAI
ncbi:uncharacterized protein STEHIDRAFT_120060 [Stereum hirsutum FP-91666 SS1]|uniref:uncharacterized protein n=1 Tax=Stereum hirsutum (strain FP-91666) TaxID=721885 RepID=UPI000440AA40|nr:uncharacterized protein STEHIDRAFT_120060 [Stereum hirsutum FP-91666 SS1]EIM87757.1 hypothetical protein STEHIDRAFT_120060 [Stereum hirsutum FP-91666 SS1]